MIVEIKEMIERVQLSSGKIAVSSGYMKTVSVELMEASDGIHHASLESPPTTLQGFHTTALHVRRGANAPEAACHRQKRDAAAAVPLYFPLFDTQL